MWLIIPSAGFGTRMQSTLPKQYKRLGHGALVLEQTLKPFIHHPQIRGIVVVQAANDPHWPLQLDNPIMPLWRTVGGQERCHSVWNGLQFLADYAKPTDWVLVHDAARCCLHPADLENLLQQLQDHPVGGLLAQPVRDTLKYCGDQQVKTISRQHLWQAQTPQMFRWQALYHALQQALAHPEQITDEASAMEQAGLTPKLVVGRSDNLKITWPEDLALADAILAHQST